MRGRATGCAAVLLCALAGAGAATAEPPVAPPAAPVDAAPCLAAIAAIRDDEIITLCGALLDDERAPRPERLRALVARAEVHIRRDSVDRAIADYDAALRLDPSQAALLNARGELWRGKGDRPRAIRDFGAAIRLDPQLAAARASYKALAQEIERIGVEMSVKPPPKPALK